MQLFRPEALRGQDRLHGDVSLVPPVSWQLLSAFLLAAVLLTALFLATAEYSKVTLVSGRLTGSKGVIRVTPVRDGVVESVYVQEGQRVSAGAPLARISIATNDGNVSLEARRSAAIARREEILRGRAPGIARASQARLDALRAQIQGDREQAVSITAQIREQSELVRTAAEDLERARPVAQRGYVSARDILQREEQLATRRQGLSRLRQELSALSARLSTTQADLTRAQSEFELENADLASAQAELAGVAASDENALSFVLTAAQAGVVTGIDVDSGDRVGPAKPVMSIVPDGTRLEARMEVPAAAAGFLEAGQTIRIAVDAFPYQTYGTVDAKIRSVSIATVPIARPDGSTDEVFLVQATLRSGVLHAYGRPQPLRPGMSINGRIATRSRKLVEWLFEPLFAVSRR